LEEVLMATGRPNGGIPRPPADVDPRIRRAIDAIREIAESIDAINSLVLASSTGILVMTGSGAFQVRSVAASNAGLLVTNGNGTAGNMTISLADDVAAIEALSTTGIACRTASNTWSLRTLTGPAAGLSITNGTGVSGNPTIALANDLSALEGLASTGLAVRTGADAWAQRTLTGPAAGIAVTNGNGVSGNPTIALVNDLSALEGLATVGLSARTGVDTWAIRILTGTTNQITILDGGGTAGNPTFSTPQDIHTGATMTLAGANLTGGATVGSGTLSLSDSVSVATGTSSGTRIGTATSQKIGFWNATPVVQPASAVQAAITDSTGGTSTGATLVNVDTAGVADVAKVNSNFAVLVALVNQLRSDMVSVGLIKGSA
jgi:hypothetical protein